MSETQPPRPAVFIDRDGTLIEDADYLAELEDMRIFDFAAESVRILREHGFLVVVVTNQSGIGRGLVTESQMHLIHDELSRALGSGVDAYYFCPHRPDENCACRKPRVEMIRRAAADLDIDIANSWMIGDKMSDIETGFNAGTGTALVLTGYGVEEVKRLERLPDIVAGDLLEAARQICERTSDEAIGRRPGASR